ncbi:MAG TPA: hypothetical protein VFT72_11570 [Opitutaceae bacterium]|nr:hypothetical protein [Opitutaceae bacterium]
METQITSTVGKYGEADWNKVRLSFASSIMMDTSLSSLAQNLDMADWPIEGADEVPSKYVGLSFGDLSALPQFAGQPKRVDQLISILRETLAFDEPFGEMLSDVTAEKDNPILKNFAKLEIPEDFPMPLVALTAETRAYCTSESLGTLKEFALFAQNMAQNVVVGGDFRALLNALSHIDERTLAMYLPYRPGQRGLHLIEGLALTVRAFPPEIQAHIAHEFGARLGPEDAARAKTARLEDVRNARGIIEQQTASYVEFFQDDLASMQQQINDGVALGRLAAVLNDAIVETIITSLLRAYLNLPVSKTPTRTSTPPAFETPPRRGGFFAAIARLFKK